jgi:hypothetical protein
MIAAFDERGEWIVLIYFGFSKNVIYMTSLREIVPAVILALFLKQRNGICTGDVSMLCSLTPLTL